jgi:hypothetical protein
MTFKKTPAPYYRIIRDIDSYPMGQKGIHIPHKKKKKGELEIFPGLSPSQGMYAQKYEKEQHGCSE